MSQYAAPGRDGSYRADPGREHPRYPETESLVMMSELEQSNQKEDDDNPFRPSSPEEFLDEGYGDEEDDEDYDNYGHYRDDPPQKEKLPARVVGGEEQELDDDSDDDLMFDDDREELDRARGDEEDGSRGEEEDEEGRREWKYSTAGIKQRGICVKYCCIGLLFLLMFAVFAVISYYIEKLFEDPGAPDEPAYMKRPDNDTFPFDKTDIDQRCSGGKISVDRGVKCREFCEPIYSACCDPFPLTKAYNFSLVNEALNRTEVEEYVYTDDAFVHLNDCHAGDYLRGCAAYSKCSALKGIVEPAPASLPFLCSDEGRNLDSQSCEAACRKARCCYDETGLSCLSENFEVCMDYAPCQNLRTRRNRGIILPVAPTDLDQQCLAKLPSCNEHCEVARCCTDPNSRCLQENFLSCLTYGACEESTMGVNLTIPPMYNLLPQAPGEMTYACNEQDIKDNQELIALIEPDSCPEYCEQVACCYQQYPNTNCFHEDPLGCLAWHHHCQTESVAIQNWYIGQFIMPTPP